ncbi:pantetheine-phosphate adenylyltransferase [Ottowia testudinis]|uniref:Phosphopantetheine adenylyltransferase n=1 Tax=Ottowia testudinis TaxID=2816950 RepID=A0A975H4A8_9BURK|nr:pantetheine-phosphate adenylyltransferase [Ottowia testudinis]QTD46698.1 pantetheine-phosphate adenylyltransferase [Ottowia testudinis]
MSRHVIAVYPGTFDPITLGHEDIVRRAAGLFDEVVIAVATAHHKKTLFTLDERLALARDAASRHGNVSVAPFDGLVRDFVVARGGKVMVRGVRGVTDFDYEFQLAGMNRNLAPDVETILMTPAAALQSVSSTLIREISQLGGDVAPYVSTAVLARLMEKRSATALQRNPSA